jgi:hypothetical protein
LGGRPESYSRKKASRNEVYGSGWLQGPRWDSSERVPKPHPFSQRARRKDGAPAVSSPGGRCVGSDGTGGHHHHQSDEFSREYDGLPVRSELLMEQGPSMDHVWPYLESHLHAGSSSRPGETNRVVRIARWFGRLRPKFPTLRKPRRVGHPCLRFHRMTRGIWVRLLWVAQRFQCCDNRLVLNRRLQPLRESGLKSSLLSWISTTPKVSMPGTLQPTRCQHSLLSINNLATRVLCFCTSVPRGTFRENPHPCQNRARACPERSRRDGAPSPIHKILS